MELRDVLILASGVGLVYLYFTNKRTRSEELKRLIDSRNAEANEIHRVAQELRDGIVKKKEAYEKAKLKVFEVIDGDKSDSKPDDGKS